MQSSLLVLGKLRNSPQVLGRRVHVLDAIIVVAKRVQLKAEGANLTITLTRIT